MRGADREGVLGERRERKQDGVEPEGCVEERVKG